MKPLLEKFRPFDVIIITYAVTLSLLIVLFEGITCRAGWNLLALCGYVGSILTIVHLFGDADSGWQAVVRRAYPMFTLFFLYEQSGQFIHLIFPGFFDYQIIALERSILGCNPTILLQDFSFPALNELFHLGYFSYYFQLPVLGAYLYVNRRYDHFEKVITSGALALLISYIFFVLYPVEGPRYALADSYSMALQGYLFVPMAKAVIHTAGLHGGCMPSSHVAVAVVGAVLSRRYAAKLFPAFLFLSVTLTIGTVWGRFHYVSDAAAGIALGFFAVWLADRLCKPAGEGAFPRLRMPTV